MASEPNGNKSHSDSNKATPFQGKQLYGMPSDFVAPKILNIEDTDERLWVCQLSHILAAQSKSANRNTGPSSTLRVFPPAPL
jgi:hypothetical protein